MTSSSSNARSILVDLLPFEVKLTRGLSSGSSRRLTSPVVRWWHESFRRTSNDQPSVNTGVLSDKLVSYLNDFFLTSFQQQRTTTLYAPFDQVILTEQKQQRILLESIKSDRSITTSQIPRQRPYLRHLADSAVVTIVNYHGVAMFVRDGDLQIPKANVVQLVELQALSDEEGIFLSSLQNSPVSYGLSTTQSFTASIITQPPPSGDKTALSNQKVDKSGGSGIGTLLTVGLSVGACSFILLAFSIFFVHRHRRMGKKFHGMGSKEERIGLSQHKAATPDETEDDYSPNTQNINAACAPSLINVDLEGVFDDAISDYTESVYSAPVRTSRIVPSNVDEHSSLMNEAESSGRIDCRYGESGYEDQEIDNKVPSSPVSVSSRFSPRYLVSNVIDDETSCSDSAFEAFSFSVGMHESVQMSETRENSNYRSSMDLGMESTGLYPDDVIENDITSSLTEYGKGIAEFYSKRRHKYASEENASLASTDSYGYSLEGFSVSSTLKSN